MIIQTSTTLLLIIKKRHLLSPHHLYLIIIPLDIIMATITAVIPSTRRVMATRTESSALIINVGSGAVVCDGNNKAGSISHGRQSISWEEVSADARLERLTQRKLPTVSRVQLLCHLSRGRNAPFLLAEAMGSSFTGSQRLRGIKKVLN